MPGSDKSFALPGVCVFFAEKNASTVQKRRVGTGNENTDGAKLSVKKSLAKQPHYNTVGRGDFRPFFSYKRKAAASKNFTCRGLISVRTAGYFV